MTTQKVVEAAELYLSRQPVHTLLSGKPLYEHKQMIRAFCAGEIAVINHEDHTPTEAVGSFQQRVRPWMMACFGEMIAGDREERNHRFLGEALELVQSTGCTVGEAHLLVDYVYGRAIGEPHQEVGGVMVTLAALCLANELDMHEAAETELARIWTKVEQIRAKQAAKPKHSPLPEAVTPPPSPHLMGSEPVAWTMKDSYGCDYITMSKHQAALWPKKTPLYAAQPAPAEHVVGAWSLPSSIEKAILDHLSWIESNISDPRAQYGLTPTQLARTANEASNKLKEALVEYQANSGSAYWSNVLKDVISWVERTGVADNEPPEYLALIAAEAVASGAKARLVGANIPPPRVVDIDTLRNEVEKLCCRGRHDGSPLVLQDSVLALVDLLPRGTEKASYPVDFSKLYSHPLATSFHEMVKKLEGLGCSAEITSAINQLHALKGEVEAEINRQLWKPPLSEIIEALQDCEDYFDNRSDADCDQVGFIPNAEMALLSKVQTALEPFKVTKPVIDTSTEIE